MQPNYGQPGTDVLPAGAYDPNVTGLEDFNASDMRMPRLSIDHEKGGFVDSLNPDNAMPEIQVIPLGLIKQRVMWPALMTDDGGDSNPMCKSVDHNTGYPNITSTDQRELFPWQASGWNPNDFPRDDVQRIVLPCNSCRLKEWKSHPDGKKTWCSEQYAMPLLYAPVDPSFTLQQEPTILALYTAQRSSINSAKAFFAGMVRQQKPAFAFRARFTLKREQRGKNTYYVPLMTVIGSSGQDDWPAYAASYTEVRAYLTQPPRVRDDQQQAGVSGAGIAQNNQMGGFQNTTWAPGQQAAPAQTAPVQTAQPVDPAYEAWKRQQAQQAAPVQQVPVAQPVPQPQPSVVQATPVVGGPVVGGPISPAQPAPSSSTAGRDDEGEDPLPF